MNTVIVLGLMIWIVKRVRHSGEHQRNDPATLLSAENTRLNPNDSCASVRILQQPMIMACPILETNEYNKQELEMNHYVIT